MGRIEMPTFHHMVMRLHVREQCTGMIFFSDRNIENDIHPSLYTGSLSWVVTGCRWYKEKENLCIHTVSKFY